MEILYLLVPLSVVLVFLIAIAFWWSLRSGQFDDLEGPGYRILMDDDKAQPKAAKAAQPNVAKAAQPKPATAAQQEAVTAAPDAAESSRPPPAGQ